MTDPQSGRSERRKIAISNTMTRVAKQAIAAATFLLWVIGCPPGAGKVLEGASARGSACEEAGSSLPFGPGAGTRANP
jgi:hypothetical protein